MAEINIVDSPMGSGKTTAIINYINSNPTRKYIYIAPFLSEGERIKSHCSSLNFCAPSELFSKTADLKNLISDGKNIVSTHALFKLIDNSTIDLLKSKDYVLIMDEVIDIVDITSISEEDRKLLLDSNFLEVDSNNKLHWNAPSYTGKFNDIKQMAKTDKLFLFDEKIIIWQFPVEAFEGFKDVYILTYLFSGSKLKSYFDTYNLKYSYFYIDDSMNIQKGIFDDRPFKERIRPLINLYEGNLNDIGEKTTALSANWFKSSNRMEHIKLKRDVYNYFRHIVDTPSKLNMWSVFSKYEDRYKGDGYTKGFVACNSRATNDYRDKMSLAYLVNVYENPILVHWFNYRGASINEDDFALSQLLQWIWRSRIRDGKEINLYIPSSRMRNLFTEWLYA